ncbi:MAG: hypothetical protein PHX83_06905 [Acidobacteriia bacterium]|nr:hypothetical protein [Terriglobia bacterium]
MTYFELKVTGLSEAERSIAGAAKRMNSTVIRSVAEEAQLLRKMIVKGLRDQAPGGDRILPLSPMTIAMRKLPRKGAKRGRRGSTKALIYNGDLIGGVNAKKQQPVWWTVGVHREERSKDGKSLADIAIIQEKGTRAYVITVTPKMHRFSIFLMMQGVLKAPWPVGKTLRCKIPARPFLEPTYVEWGQEAESRFSKRIENGILGLKAS